MPPEINLSGAQPRLALGSAALRVEVFTGTGPSIAEAHRYATAEANRWLGHTHRVVRSLQSETVIHPQTGRFYAAITVMYEE